MLLFVIKSMILNRVFCSISQLLSKVLKKSASCEMLYLCTEIETEFLKSLGNAVLNYGSPCVILHLCSCSADTEACCCVIHTNIPSDGPLPEYNGDVDHLLR